MGANDLKQQKDDKELNDINQVIRHFFTDPNVIKLMLDIWIIIQAWDDAYDGEEADHLPAYKAAMIDLPFNPIYQDYPIALLIKQMYIDWQAANQLEEQQEHLHKAYMLRAGYYRIITTLIAFIEGDTAAEQKAADVWRCYSESYDDYEAEMLCQLES